MEQGTKVFFPLKTVPHLTHQPGKIYLPAGDSSWWECNEKDLTERELALLEMVLGKRVQPAISHPWLQFLQGETEQAPQRIEHIQFLHVRLWKTAEDEDSKRGWLEMMQELLPMQVAAISVSETDYLFILEQRQFVDIAEILQGTLSAMEFDFGLRLTFFVGQIWSRGGHRAISELYQEEKSLFALWQERCNQATVLRFSQLILWGQSLGELRLPVIRRALRQLLDSQEMRTIIVALWQEGAVATKAAQRLYIHRNTLQYRLEKWHELTGLQLRDLTDLACCYSLVLEDTF